MDKIKDLEDIRIVFEKFKVPFILVYGAVLGMHRDGKLIDHDDDIDLAVIEQIDLKTRMDIGWALYDLGFQPQEIAFNIFGRMCPSCIGYNGDENTGIIVCKRNFNFTIFFFGRPEFCRQHNETELVCIPMLGAMRLIATPQKFFEKFGKVKINKKEYLTPYPIEKYLEYCYKDWKDKMGRDHSPTFNEAHAVASITKEEANSVMITK